MLHIQLAVGHHVRHRLQVRIVPHHVGRLVLTEAVAAPAVVLSVLADGDDVILTGGHEGDLCVLHLFGNLLDVDSRRADAADAPHVNLTVIGKADGEAAVAVDHLDVARQLRGNVQQVHRRRQVLLRRLGERVVILGHEMRRDEHDREHDQHHDHGEHRELPVHETVQDLPSRAHDQLAVVRHAVLVFDLLVGNLIRDPEPFFLILDSENPPHEPAGKLPEYVFFLLFHLLSLLLLADAHAGIHDAVAQVDHQVREKSDEGVDHLQEHDHIVISVPHGVQEQQPHALEAEHGFQNH